MNILITFFISVIMLFITIIHIYWLFGGLWPGDDYQNLVDKVLGSGNKLPNKFMFLIVILIFLSMSLFPILVLSNIDFFGYQKKIFLFLSIIFLIRSIYIFIPFISDKVTKIFYELNKRIYAPICFILSIFYFYLYYRG